MHDRRRRWVPTGLPAGGGGGGLGHRETDLAALGGKSARLQRNELRERALPELIEVRRPLVRGSGRRHGDAIRVGDDRRQECEQQHARQFATGHSHHSPMARQTQSMH
jgi:hypothetical protein